MSVTRYPSGVSTAPWGQLFGQLPLPNPVRDHVYANDFDTYAAADWTVTTTTGTSALVAANGGVLRLSTAASSSDIQANQKLPAAFSFISGAQLWFGVLMSIATNATSVARAGLMTGGTTLVPTDGVYWAKAAAGAWDFVVKTGGATTTLAGIGGTPTDGTLFALGFYYDGNTTNPTLRAYSSIGMTLPSVAAGNNNSGGQVVGAPVLTNLPASLLAPTIAIQASTAAIRTLDLDYLVCANDINRF